MAGTIEGGKRAAQTNKNKFGEDFYKRIGSKGGTAITDKPKGFAFAAANGLSWHKEAGRKGGTISRKNKNAN